MSRHDQPDDTSGRAMLSKLRERMMSDITPSEALPSVPFDVALLDEIARLTALGVSPHEIMAQTRISAPVMGSVLRSPDFKSRVRSFLPPVPTPEEVRELFLDEVEKSVEKLSYLRDNAASEKVQLSATRDLLDRAGFTPIRRVASISYFVPRDRQGLVRDTLKSLVEDDGSGEPVEDPDGTPETR